MEKDKQGNIVMPDAGFTNEHSELAVKPSDPLRHSFSEASVASSGKKDMDSSLRGNDKNQEFGGRGGLDPSRYGDWEIAGKCVDF